MYILLVRPTDHYDCIPVDYQYRRFEGSLEVCSTYPLIREALEAYDQGPPSHINYMCCFELIECGIGQESSVLRSRLYIPCDYDDEEDSDGHVVDELSGR